jgi:murein DD-endopeptidase MepM/ murein hydrolase activator NlpD
MSEDKLRTGHSLKLRILIPGGLVLALIALGILRVGGTPDIRIDPRMSAIGKRTPVKITISEPRRGLKHVKVELTQDGKGAILAEKNYPFSSQFWWGGSKIANDTIDVEAGRQTLPSLTQGSASIRVTADRAGTWLWRPSPVVQEVNLPVRLTPPSLQVTSTQTYVAQGGCEAVTYKAGESTVRDGVRAGSWWFPGYPLPGGGKQDRFAFFAVPYDMSQLNVRLVAEDGAGNEAEMGFIDRFTAKSFKSDNLEITDAFLQKVVPEIMSQTPELNDRGSILGNYLAINRDLRQKDGAILRSMAQKSTPAFLWTKPFLVMPNAKVMATFAEHRIYHYQGGEIDQQDHLGFDLAATKQYPIPAANDGRIAYARFFGIYGNAVVIDHGYGLSTIYGHLSSIAVSEGQTVSRGALIGRTGETGLAGGDHLHFCTLLQGLPVDPSEWSDGHWIKDRIAKKLGTAFAFAP